MCSTVMKQHTMWPRLECSLLLCEATFAYDGRAGIMQHLHVGILCSEIQLFCLLCAMGEMVVVSCFLMWECNI